jgi:hypothetical protein
VIGSPIARMSPGPSVPGKVTRISPESVEILYVAVPDRNPVDTEEIDILAADFVRPVRLERFPVRLISDVSTTGGAGPTARRRVLGFNGITPEQRNQLQSFIYSFAY